ncbi:MAG: hypothetical protein P8Y42_19210, partial [Exilibacterium sp.]
QPLPESHTGEHLPQMSTYSGSSQSRNTSVPQPINYGGRASGYNGVSQSRTTNVSQPISGGGTYSGTTQSRRTRVPQIESSSTLRNGRTTGSGSGALQRAEPKGRVLNAMHNFVHCERRGRNYDSLREAANNRGWDSSKTWHFKPAGEALSDLGLDVDYHDSQPDSWSKFPDKAIVGVKEDGQARAVYLNGDYIYDGNALEPHHRNAYAISDESSFLEIKSKR